MKTETITITHNGIPITYDEDRNLWLFELRGRDRSAQGLADAREAIEKQPAKPAKAFEKIPAWYSTWAECNKVEVTGIAERGYRNETEVWVKLSDGSRKKCELSQLKAASESNASIIAEIEKRVRQSEKLSSEVSALRSKLEPLKLEIPE